MAKSPRAEALHYARSGQEIQAPPLPDLEPNSPEARAFLQGLEPLRYAALAVTIDTLFDRVLATRSGRPPDGLLSMDAIVPPEDAWDQLGGDITNTFIDAVDDIRHTKAFQNSTGFNRLFGTLDTERQLSVDRQLYSGTGTAKNALLLFFRNAPRLIAYHTPSDEQAPEPLSVLRHPGSKRLVSRLAKIGINQLMAAEDALLDYSQPPDVSDDRFLLDPKDFQLVYDRRGRPSLAYDDFTKLEVPAGYSPHPRVKRVEQPTRVVDFPNNRPTVIGCPISLLEGRLQQLIDWTAEVADRRGLWDPAEA